MPFYKILVHGTNLKIACIDGQGDFGGIGAAGRTRTEPDIVGFYATRLVSATDSAEAVSRLKKQMQFDWVYGKYAELNASKSICLEIESVEKISWFSGIYNSLPRFPLITVVFPRFPTKGHTFYPEN